MLINNPGPERPEYQQHVDTLTLRVAFGEYPSLPAEEVWELGAGNRKVGDAQQLAAVLEETILWTPDRDHEYPHTLDIREARFSWGAEATTIAVIVYLSSQALDVLVGDATRSGLNRAMQFLQGLRNAEAEIEHTKEDMEAEARWRAEAAYDVPPQTLRLLADEYDDDLARSEFTFIGTTDRYIVTMGVLDGIPHSSRVRRESLDGAP